MTERDDDLLAAEFVLGLLSTAEAATVETRATTDVVLALRIAWWGDRLAPLADESAIDAPGHIWPQIAARLGSNDNARDNTRPWKWATGLSSAVAALLLGVIVLRPTPVPPAPPSPTVPAPTAPMVASLSGAEASVTVAFDATTARLLVTPVTLDRGAGDAQLWVIPVGREVPVPLGVIDAQGAGFLAVDAADVALLTPGATIAISQEVRGGSPTGAPQGPIVATGKIIRV